MGEGLRLMDQWMAARMAEADMGAAETYRSGEITFRVQVQARFAIADD